MTFAFPSWLDARLATDAAFGAAYDALSPQERACIKTGIARMAALENGGYPVAERSSRTMRQGFSLHTHTCPADWAVVMWDTSRAGPSRVLAALLPAMLAGVPNILACCVADGGEPLGGPVLAALELAGQETVAALSPDEALALVSHCCDAETATRARGRLVLLGTHAAMAAAADIAAGRDTPCRRMGARSRIGIAVSSWTKPVSDEHLALMHPDALLVPLEKDAAQSGYAAVFCAAEKVADHLGAAPLVLSPGNEGFWRWPGIDAAFYRETCSGIFDADADPDA